MRWILFFAWLTIGIVVLCQAEVSKVQYACVWIPFLVQLLNNAIG